MSRIIKARSKYSKRYITDFWGFLTRVRPKVNNKFSLWFQNKIIPGGIRFDNNVKLRGVSYASFSRAQRILARARGPKQTRLKRPRLFVHLARLRFFLGGMNVDSIRNFFKRARKARFSAHRISTLVESRLDVFLFRIHFIMSITDGRKYITDGFFSINGKICYNWNTLLHVGDIVSVSTFEKRVIIFKHILRRFYYARSAVYRYSRVISSKSSVLSYDLCNGMGTPGHILWYVPGYIEVNYRLLEAQFVRAVAPNELRYPFLIDIMGIGSFFHKRGHK